jgi:hypothetical protein
VEAQARARHQPQALPRLMGRARHADKPRPASQPTHPHGGMVPRAGTSGLGLRPALSAAFLSTITTLPSRCPKDSLLCLQTIPVASGAALRRCSSPLPITITSRLRAALWAVFPLCSCLHRLLLTLSRVPVIGNRSLRQETLHASDDSALASPAHFPSPSPAVVPIPFPSSGRTIAIERGVR